MSDETPEAKKPRTTKSKAKASDPAAAETTDSTTAAGAAETATVSADDAAADADAGTEAAVEPQTTAAGASAADELASPPADPDPATSEYAAADGAAAATADPAATVGATPQVIYITAPVPPRRQGNRGIGAVIALVSGLLFLALLALAGVLLGYLIGGRWGIEFLAQPQFYVPVLLFVVAFVLLVLIVNRGNWWAYILGSILVGAAVYLGTAAVGMLFGGVIQDPSSAGRLFRAELTQPFVVIAGLLAREVSMWVGAGIARRGRTVKRRNVEARTAYEQELAEKQAERERYLGASG